MPQPIYRHDLFKTGGRKGEGFEESDLDLECHNELAIISTE
jgi:hypothetical protein